MGNDEAIFVHAENRAIPLSDIREALAAMGLHVVDAEGTALIAEGARLLALAQAENARLQAINAHLSADIAAKVHDHREEVERLRAELAGAHHWEQQYTRENTELKTSLAAANALLEMCDGETDSTDVQTALTDYFAAQPATAPIVATCDACKRARCECLERDCDKCHWPGSPNCRREGLKP
jgi:chromosome segregation ATPase